MKSFNLTDKLILRTTMVNALNQMVIDTMKAGKPIPVYLDGAEYEQIDFNYAVNLGKIEI